MIPTEPILRGHVPFDSAAIERATAETISRDANLREQILDELAQRGIRPSQDLQIDVRHRKASIRGRVPSYYQRQLIIHSIGLVPGIDAVDDTVDVVASADLRRSLCRPWLADSRSRGVAQAVTVLFS